MPLGGTASLYEQDGYPPVSTRATAGDIPRPDADSADDGLRINRAAGLAISVGRQDQIDGMTQAGQNAGNGVDVPQTAQGALTQSTDILQQMGPSRGPGRQHRQPDADIAQETTKLAQADSQLLAQASAWPQTLVKVLLG